MHGKILLLKLCACIRHFYQRRREPLRKQYMAHVMSYQSLLYCQEQLLRRNNNILDSVYMFSDHFIFVRQNNVSSLCFRTFKIRALNMMDTLFQTDKKVAFNIMDNLETVWKIQATPIAFAYEFQMYDVIAHPSTVALMNKKWYRGMVPSWKQLFTKTAVNDVFFLRKKLEYICL